METNIVKINQLNPEPELIIQGARYIREGKLVAFPTETVYGLGANGLDEDAVANIFAAKGRPQDNPLILHVSKIDDIKPLVKSISKEAKVLMEEYWPGPLTILFERSNLVPDIITAGLDTVALRMPNHPVALELIEISGVPIAAPSANTSGKPSPTLAEHVIKDLNGKVDMILDGGATGVGLESTVLDLTGEVPVVLRPGGITLEAIRSYFPKAEMDLSLINSDEKIIPKSPGQKYRHYAPRAEMIVFNGKVDSVVEAIKAKGKEYVDQGKLVGIMATDETKNRYAKGIVISVGSRRNRGTIAHNLFDTLRQFDERGVDIILSEGIEMGGIGTAIMNRLKKASGGNIIEI